VRQKVNLSTGQQSSVESKAEALPSPSSIVATGDLMVPTWFFNGLLAISTLLAAPPKNTGQFPVWFTAVYGVGFIAAVSIGTYAWKNSRRPGDLPGKDVKPES
jgi:hypothetical protein